MIPNRLRFVALALVSVPAVAAGQTSPATVVARYRAARLATMEQNASSETVEALLRLLTDSAVYEHPQAGARIAGKQRIGDGIRSFLGTTRRPRIEVLRAIVTGQAVAAQERVSFEMDRDGRWVPASRTQLTVYLVEGDRIARELQYWAPGKK